MLKTGKILQSRYRIEKQIGQGGMGSVYLATDERFNNTVAIKETLFADDNYRKAFSREARLLNSLKHTALPKVSDHFIDGNGQYIVMEYIAGDDLFEMIEQSGEAFPFEDVLVWANQLLDALEYLHGQSNPIIHRDIKPQNLKLTPHGQVILLDFGLAKGNPTDAKHQTAANSIFGYSRNYASLEQIQGTGTDPRSDIYSLAATLYHLATGKPPADALTRVMLVLNEGEDPLQPAHLIHEQVPEDFSIILERAMSLKGSERPQTAAEMRQMIFDEETTAVSTRPKMATNKAFGANLLTQNTKIFGDGEKSVNDSKQSDINTEVLPENIVAGDSVNTKIAKPRTLTDRGDTINSGVITESRPNRKPFLAIAAVGVLMLVGSVASMVYFMGSERNSSGFDGNNAIDPNAAISNISVKENPNPDVSSDESNSVFNLSNKNWNASGVKETAEKPDTAVKTEPSVKENASAKENKPTADNSKGTGVSKSDVRVSDGKVEMDGMVITEEGIETDEAIMNEKGIFLKNGQKVMVTREQYEKLSPEQKQKVRDAIEMQKKMEAQKRLRDRKKLPPPPPRRPPPKPPEQ